ncbi:MAG: redox-sensing transcriptional repressor Rex [Spirochaetaceae bacterium]|nr:redox-sensing transcriptional repressor Rex [Spirochaetaceae bacterium]
MLTAEGKGVKLSVKYFTDRRVGKDFMKTNIAFPAIERLTKLFSLLLKAEQGGKEKISSTELGSLTGFHAHNIRKDISAIGSIESGKGGYSIKSLESLISSTFGFERKKKVCVAGLDMLGAAMLNNPDAGFSEFEIIAGFDSNINRMEMISTKVPLFHFYKIEEKVKELGIEYAILAVSPEEAARVAERLIAGGVKGILNFSPVIIAPKNGVQIRNIYLVEELRLLSALNATNFQQL